MKNVSNFVLNFGDGIKYVLESFMYISRMLIEGKPKNIAKMEKIKSEICKSARVISFWLYLSYHHIGIFIIVWFSLLESELTYS